nr:MAG TPA: hypothetical protein [Caudoviricetes sp.]
MEPCQYSIFQVHCLTLNSVFCTYPPTGLCSVLVVEPFLLIFQKISPLSSVLHQA